MSMVQPAPLKFGTRSVHPTLFWVSDYLSMLGLKLIHVSNMGTFGTCSTPWPAYISIQEQR